MVMKGKGLSEIVVEGQCYLVGKYKMVVSDLIDVGE